MATTRRLLDVHHHAAAAWIGEYALQTSGSDEVRSAECFRSHLRFVFVGLVVRNRLMTVLLCRSSLNDLKLALCWFRLSLLSLPQCICFSALKGYCCHGEKL